MKKIKNLFNIKNKCIVVVGGNGIVGRKIVFSLSKLGAKVFVLSRSAPKKKIKSVKYLSLDQTDELNVKTVIKKINKISSPDVLIYSSLVRPMTKFLKDSSKNWAESMRVNSTGMFIICREFANLMKKK